MKIDVRVWNGEQMISPDYITRDGVAHWKENSIPTSSDITMLFAGLKDKHGKKIYEGDLWRDIDETGQFEDGIYEICYDSYNAEFSSRRKSSKYPIRDDGYTYYDFCLRNITIIGNIYENPELIEKL